MKKLNRLGVSFSLDDFGTGYTSISSLSGLPVKHIKIDSSLIWELDDEVSSRTVVKSMIETAKYLNLNIIAEGIEIRQEFDYLKNRGCHNFQGYLFQPPVTFTDFVQLTIK